MHPGAFFIAHGGGLVKPEYHTHEGAEKKYIQAKTMSVRGYYQLPGPVLLCLLLLIAAAQGAAGRVFNDNHSGVLQSVLPEFAGAQPGSGRSLLQTGRGRLQLGSKAWLLDKISSKIAIRSSNSCLSCNTVLMLAAISQPAISRPASHTSAVLQLEGWQRCC